MGSRDPVPMRAPDSCLQATTGPQAAGGTARGKALNRRQKHFWEETCWRLAPLQFGHDGLDGDGFRLRWGLGEEAEKAHG